MGWGLSPMQRRGGVTKPNRTERKPRDARVERDRAALEAARVVPPAVLDAEVEDLISAAVVELEEADDLARERGVVSFRR